MDTTEPIRRQMVSQINNTVASDNKETERKRLEAIHGKGNVFDTDELSDNFEVIGFMAPFVVVRRLSDNKRGSLLFQHSPRFYFDWHEK